MVNSSGIFCNVIWACESEGRVASLYCIRVSCGVDVCVPSTSRLAALHFECRMELTCADGTNTDLGYIWKLSRGPNGSHILHCIVRLELLAVLSAVWKWKSGVVYYTWFEVAWLIKLRTVLKGRLKIYVICVCRFCVLLLFYCDCQCIVQGLEGYSSGWCGFDWAKV